ncbi:hypothetical protein LYNGBM3L_54260 [Moorena producens 3L]|uniref:Uncharacterized protein n=1 Tax=Moorena producens 3L TaxID=489825 RepID=F4XQM2_9CYAN|nr:hypothetical protein LYNGBM3L_54260 [Moorena producens 3L]
MIFQKFPKITGQVAGTEEPKFFANLGTIPLHSLNTPDAFTFSWDESLPGET